MARKARAIQVDDADDNTEVKENIYFKDDSNIEYFSSGCTLVDCALGGGWAEGRFINIYGQSGSGKTLLLIEGAINYRMRHPGVKIQYVETESAFDEEYAYQLGMPRDNFKLQQDIFTVEDLFDDFEKFIKDNPKGLYIVDSWDALSDKAEIERKIDESSFGAAKAKKLSEMFRRLNHKMGSADVTLISVSQVRDNIGVSFGRKYTRSGGKALQFYGSQIITINEKKKITKVIDKITRVVGIESEIKVEKNKAGTPFRTCIVPIYFGYGIDNIEAGLTWLEEIGKEELFEELGLTSSNYGRYLQGWRKAGNPDLEAKINAIVRREWDKIEATFAIGRSKYGAVKSNG